MLELDIIPSSQNLVSPFITISEISIIIPVKDNQLGIDLFLNSFFNNQEQNNYPKEIIIVDNNSNPPIKINKKHSNYKIPIVLLLCCKPGPAAARNLGAKYAVGNWLLFTDSDCIPTKTFLTGYLNNNNGSIAYAGNIKALGKNRLSEFYDRYQILIPQCIDKKYLPKYTTTANTIIWKKSFEKVSGFKESFRIAGGEDVDLGKRLWEHGKLSFALDSIVLHNFDNGWWGFIKRFIRYGKGERIIEEEWKVNRKPNLIHLKRKTLFDFKITILWFLCERVGYYLESSKLRKLKK